MAASMMMTTVVSSGSVLPARCAQSVRDLGFSKCASSTPSFFIRSSTTRALQLGSRRGEVRCNASDGSRDPKEQVKSVTIDQINSSQSDKQSASGGKSTNGSPPNLRPELERRVETGSQGLGTVLGDGLREVREEVDWASKRTITADQIKINQAQNESEKQSVFGAKPVDGASPYPRPELERRPETGSRGLGSIFAFDGAGPETINGRLAMVGLVWAFLAEKSSGLTVFEQLYTAAGGLGLVYYVAVVQLITFASLIPFLNGESTDARSFGPFRGKAERWNGRLAMLGFLALVLTEHFTHSAVLSWWS